MTAEPITIGPDDTVARAYTLMRHGRLRHLPVVAEGKLLLGLITQRDLLAATGGPGPKAESTLVKTLMVREVLTATAKQPLRRAARTMYDKKFGCLPVVDEAQRVVGILTETDFIRFAAEMATELDRVEAAASRQS